MCFMVNKVNYSTQESNGLIPDRFGKNTVFSAKEGKCSVTNDIFNLLL